MKESLLEQLDTQAILLLYLADELSAQDRRNVEQRLAADPALAGELQSLRDLYESCRQTMSAPEAGRQEALEAAASRGASRLMHRWAEQRRRPRPAVVETARSIHWLRYGLSAAAALLLSGGIWWSYHRSAVQPGPAPAPVAVVEDSDEQLALVLDSMDASAADDSSDRQIATTVVKAEETDLSVDTLVDLPPVAN